MNASNIVSNESKKGHGPARDPDLVNSEAALRRAREEARVSVGYVVIYRDGKIVEDRLDKRVPVSVARETGDALYQRFAEFFQIAQISVGLDERLLFHRGILTTRN